MHENSSGSHMSPFLPNLCFPVKEMFTKRLTPSELDKPVLVLKSTWDCNIMNIWFINWLARCFLAVLIIKDYYREVNFLTTTDSLNVYCLKGVLFCGAEERWPVILLWYLCVFFQYGICNGLTVAVISAFLLFFCMQTLIHPCLRQYILLTEFLAGYFLFGFLHYKEAFPVSVSYFPHHIITLS